MLYQIVSSGKYLWCYGITENDSYDSEDDSEVPDTKRKKKIVVDHATSKVNSVELKADRINALAKKLEKKH